VFLSLVVVFTRQRSQALKYTLIPPDLGIKKKWAGTDSDEIKTEKLRAYKNPNLGFDKNPKRFDSLFGY
jgi:hypothetical protein